MKNLRSHLQIQPQKSHQTPKTADNPEWMMENHTGPQVDSEPRDNY